MEKLCKNCKYYRAYNEELSKGFGGCDCPKFKYNTAYNWKENGLEKDCLLYMDYEWYKAGIEVGEDFCCVHYKKED